MSSSDILKEMIDAATPKVTSCSSAINQIDIDVASLTAQANAIKEGMMDVIAADVDHYLNHMWIPVVINKMNNHNTKIQQNPKIGSV